MPPKATVLTSITFSAELHRRAKEVAKRERSSVSLLVRTGLFNLVREKEALFASEDNAKKSARAETFERRLRGLGAGNKPAKPATPSDTQEAQLVEEDTTDHLADIFNKHAQLLLHVLESPHERQLLTYEAVQEIQKYAPLTCPQPRDIVKRLEREVLRLREMAPPLKEKITLDPETLEKSDPNDALVGRRINIPSALIK